MKKIITTLALILAISFCFCACSVGNSNSSKENETAYNNALSLIENKDYEGAYEVLKTLGDYKDSAKLLERFMFVPTSINNGDETVRFYYNDSGFLIQRIETSNGKNTIFDLAYDGNGMPIKKTCTYRSGSQDSWEGTYDENGNLIKEAAIIPNWYEKRNYEHIYDAEGNRIKTVCVRTITLSDTPYEYKTITDYTYDANGNLIKEIYTYSDGDKEILDYTYDANGNLIKEIRTASYDNNEYINSATYKLIYIPVDAPTETKELWNGYFAFDFYWNLYS